jgi:hypothetical protein
MRSPAMVYCDEEVSVIFFKLQMSLVRLRRMEFVVLVNDDDY